MYIIFPDSLGEGEVGNSLLCTDILTLFYTFSKVFFGFLKLVWREGMSFMGICNHHSMYVCLIHVFVFTYFLDWIHSSSFSFIGHTMDKVLVLSCGQATSCCPLFRFTQRIYHLVRIV